MLCSILFDTDKEKMQNDTNMDTNNDNNITNKQRIYIIR